jgi:hypothetical protein
MRLSKSAGQRKRSVTLTVWIKRTLTLALQIFIGAHTLGAKPKL